MPVLTDRLVLNFYDKGTISDTMFGSLVLSVKKLLALGNIGHGARDENGQELEPTGYLLWENIYGAQENYNDAKEAQLMNENPELASNWRGEVLMQVIAFEEEKPKKLV